MLLVVCDVVRLACVKTLILVVVI